jgi:hypothetical protein
MSAKEMKQMFVQDYFEKLPDIKDRKLFCRALVIALKRQLPKPALICAPEIPCGEFVFVGKIESFRIMCAYNPGGYGNVLPPGYYIRADVMYQELS